MAARQEVVAGEGEPVYINETDNTVQNIVAFIYINEVTASGGGGGGGSTALHDTGWQPRVLNLGPDNIVMW